MKQVSTNIDSHPGSLKLKSFQGLVVGGLSQKFKPEVENRLIGKEELIGSIPFCRNILA